MHILPEPKQFTLHGGQSPAFRALIFEYTAGQAIEVSELAELAALRFWDYPDLLEDDDNALSVTVTADLSDIDVDSKELFEEQGYVLEISAHGAKLRYAQRQGYLNGLSTLKTMIADLDAARRGTDELFVLPTCLIVDHPSIQVRAVAPTFSWYAGYGRLGFDMQLWGRDEWVRYLHQCLDQKINQLNMVMYGYWPFTLEQYPETVFRDVPVEIWNAENQRWLKVRYSHPNVEDDFLGEFLELAHRLGVKVLAYVGLNSYNGAWTIKHPEKRMKPPTTGGFLNDFDSVCLSDQENLTYLIESMSTIAKLGFDGFTLEESEEGFWFCECEGCRERWHSQALNPGHAKHLANMWLLRQLYDAVRAVNPDVIVGIRAFRQPPLEKDPDFLRQVAASMPEDIMLFWAPALYVPPSEFKKWVATFGADHIWGRDSESNAITSTMGRLYRVFESNLIRYEDEQNVQSIERDIEMHLTSVEEGVHGINGFMFEWYGLFMHQWAHANYGWGSRMPMDEFFAVSCDHAFGPELGPRVLRVLRGILSIHESQIPLYTTAFPFQSNVITEADLPRIGQAINDHETLLTEIRTLRAELARNPRTQCYDPHFARLENAERRNRVIYDLVLAALAYEREEVPAAKDRWLDEILRHNEADFAIAREMFFDLKPVLETGVRSCMMPYHELKRLVHNIRHPDSPDADVICSGIEAMGWLWLADEEFEKP